MYISRGDDDDDNDDDDNGDNDDDDAFLVCESADSQFRRIQGGG